jgi:hypothetical protein
VIKYCVFLFLKDRFQRCAMACADKIKDREGLDKTQHRVEMETCVKSCSDEMIQLVPAFSKRMNSWFKSKSYLN